MNQHQAGCAGVPAKRLKQTALTWKVKGKATSHVSWQEVMQGSQSVRKSGGAGRDCPPQSFDWGTAASTPPNPPHPPPCSFGLLPTSCLEIAQISSLLKNVLH